MKWLRVRIRAFRSFIEEQEFTFPEGPGLYFLTGRNEAQPRLGANGAGKTTLWEALHWLWFDKTVTGLSAGQVAPWDGVKGTRVELDYEVDGDLYTLGRTWSPNRWYLVHGNGADELLTKDGSNLALKHLGMGPVPFLHSVLMAQGEPMFLDLKPEAATSMFSQVLELDRWVDLSAKASSKAADQDKELRSLESQVARVRGQLDGLAAEQFPYTAEEWEARRDQELSQIEAEHKKHSQERAEVSKKLREADQRVDHLRKTMARTEPDRARSDDRVGGDTSARVDALRASEAVLLSDAKKLRKRCEEAEKNPACPECGHVLSPKEQDELLLALVAEEEAIDDQLADIQSELQQLMLKKQAEETARVVANNVRRDAERNLDFALSDVRSYEREVGQLDKILDSLEAQAARLVDQVNPVKDAEARLATRRKELLRRLAALEDELATAEARWRLYTYWVRGFKEIRLSQVSSALTQLEIEVNSCVNQLGLVGWKLLFRSDSETKSGAVKRGFAVEVLSPSNSKPVPWKSWSGGEAQRLRLAGNMGLANLIRDRMGVSLPIEVWDEPTQFLSPQGVTDLLDGLAVRAQSEQRQIWVVDHRSLGYGAFDGVVTVVKDRKGSRFEI